MEDKIVNVVFEILRVNTGISNITESSNNFLAIIGKVYEKYKGDKEITAILDKYYNHSGYNEKTGKLGGFKEGYNVTSVARGLGEIADSILTQKLVQLESEVEASKKERAKAENLAILKAMKINLNADGFLNEKDNLFLIAVMSSIITDLKDKDAGQKKLQLEEILSMKDVNGIASMFATDKTKSLMNYLYQNLHRGDLKSEDVLKFFNKSLAELEGLSEVEIGKKFDEIIERFRLPADIALGLKELNDFSLNSYNFPNRKAGFYNSENSGDLSELLKNKEVKSTSLKEFFNDFADRISKNEITYEQSLSYLANAYKLTSDFKPSNEKADFATMKQDLENYKEINKAINQQTEGVSDIEAKFLKNLEGYMRMTMGELTKEEMASLLKISDVLKNKDVVTAEQAKNEIKGLSNVYGMDEIIQKSFQR